MDQVLLSATGLLGRNTAQYNSALDPGDHLLSKDGPIPITKYSIPAIPRSHRKISMLARSIDAFDTARSSPVTWCRVIDVILRCVIEQEHVLVDKLKTLTCLCVVDATTEY